MIYCLCLYTISLYIYIHEYLYTFYSYSIYMYILSFPSWLHIFITAWLRIHYNPHATRQYKPLKQRSGTPNNDNLYITGCLPNSHVFFYFEKPPYDHKILVAPDAETKRLYLRRRPTNLPVVKASITSVVQRFACLFVSPYKTSSKTNKK